MFCYSTLIVARNFAYVDFKLENIFFSDQIGISRQSAEMSFATRYAMLEEFGGKRGTEVF